jgi:phytoene dehydrogenase-like protein
VRDVIVIGAGHNGLVTAAYLARAGLDVLVLERRPTVGGAAVTEEPWPGYQVSTASYVVSLIPPRIMNELELARHGYRTTILEPDYYLPYPDGSSLTLWSNAERTASEIARVSPSDADAYRRFDQYLGKLGHLLHDLLFVVPPNLRLAELPRWLTVGGKLRSWSSRDAFEAVRLFTMSCADLLDEWFTNDRVKGALATQSIIGGWNGPMSPGSAYVLLHHWFGEIDGHLGAWGWVHGGMGGVGRALSNAAVAAGAEVRTEAPVKRVAVSSGRALGVELEDGSILRAKRIVSNAHPVTSFLDLVGEEHLPAETVADIRRFRSRSGSVKVNMAIAELPQPLAWKGPVPGDPHTGVMAISPSIEYLEQAWDDAKYGRPSRHPYAELVFPTVFEPELAPPGHHLALAFTQFGPYEIRDGSWEEERPRYGQRIIDTISESCPNFSGAVEHIEVLAPPDLEAKFGLLGGNIMHGEMTPDQMFFFRPVPGSGGYRTPVAGYYLCGAGTHPGGGVMGVSGRNCAVVVASDARRDRWKNKVSQGGTP